MALNILDGKGRGFRASVSSSNRLNVSSKTQERLFYISRDDGLAFNASSVDASAAAGDIIFYLKNNSKTRFLFVDHIEVHAANSALFKVFDVTGTGSGTAITSQNLNRSSSKSADVTCLGSGAVTGLTTDGLIGVHRAMAGDGKIKDYYGSLVLGPDDAIAVEYDTGTTGPAEVECFFWFEEISREN